MISLLGNELADARRRALLAEAEEADRVRQTRASAERPRVRWRALRAKFAKADQTVAAALADGTVERRHDEDDEKRPVAA